MLRVWFSFRKLSSKADTRCLPTPPKRLSGYSLFLKTVWPSLSQQHPGEKFSQLVSIAAKKWKAADSQTKQLYGEKARDISARYEKEYSEYLSSLNFEHILATGGKTKAHLKTKSRRLENTLRRLKKPRSPRSAYAFFCIEARKPNLKLSEEAKQLAEKWSALSDSEKQVYQQRAEEDKRRYHDAMIDWEMCMQQTGNSKILQEYFENNVDVAKKHLAKQLTHCEESLGG
ncbi:transcription factor A, mitochondrial-like isoform X2 [Amblyomma americanum]|uniref:HMG box domain-containing protein n=2 Tax=Amblyomma americanum TaxID=6943 RepID=A0AAQ4EDL9_AMBAM